MTQHIIGFFCGTGYTLDSDASYQYIKGNINHSTTLYGYDGCQIHGGGTFAYGVEEQADAFIKDLKNKNIDDNIQLNIIAHSRGVISALRVIQKIQADPQLNEKIKITCDFRDPVPGNLQITAHLTGKQSITNAVKDLSDCNIVNKVYITLQEKAIIGIAFDALVPKFHINTEVEIETLPGYHDAQQRNFIKRGIDHKSMLDLGNAKTLDILIKDGHLMRFHDNFKNQQIQAYNQLANWSKKRITSFGERDLHFGGKIIANNEGITNNNIIAINWRHAQLQKILPEHVLYGMTQPHYSYKKSTLEHYCDLTISLDKFIAKYPEHQELAIQIKQLSQRYYCKTLNMDDYRTQCKEIIKKVSVRNNSLVKAINSMCMHDYLHELDTFITEKLSSAKNLLLDLQALKSKLLQKLATEITHGRSLAYIENSSAIKIANNTVAYIKKVYTLNNLEDIVQASDQYVRDNIKFGRNWGLGSKILVSAIITVAATVVGCAVGIATGFVIAFAIGSITGPGALATAIIGAFIGGLSGAIAGTTAGIIISHSLFAPAAEQKEVEALAKKPLNQ